MQDPKFDADVNVLGFLNLMECAVRHEVKKTIFISSGGAIYAEANIYLNPETYPPQPLSPYAIAKLIAEHYLDNGSISRCPYTRMDKPSIDLRISVLPAAR